MFSIIKNNAKEWHVMLQYETDAWGNIKVENAILLMRDDDKKQPVPFFRFIRGHQTDDYKYYLANHDISIEYVQSK